MEKEHGPRTPDEILRAALEMETQARDFYAQLAVECSVDFVQELLQMLQNEESKHVHMVQEFQARLRAGKRLM